MGYKKRGNKLYVFGTVDGKHYRLSTGKEATPLNEKWIAKNHREVLLQLVNKDKPSQSMMFGEYAERSVKSDGYAIKHGTKIFYNYMLKDHILTHFRHYRLDEINPSDIRVWQTKLLETLEASTVKNIKNLMGKILEYAKMDELITKNAARLVKPPRIEEKEEIDPFTMEEALHLIDNSNKWFASFLTVAFFTGMRTGELMALKWDDIDFNSEKIIVRQTMSHGSIGSTKSGKSRKIDMLSPVLQALKDKFRENGLSSEFIFTSRKGTPYTFSSALYTTFWKPLLKRCGMAHKVMYNTRHTFASLMLLNGEDVLWVSKMLGHSNVSTTMRYYIKFIEEKGTKRATFLDKSFNKNCTLIAQSINKNQRHA
jgi:integrase